MKVKKRRKQLTKSLFLQVNIGIKGLKKALYFFSPKAPLSESTRTKVIIFKNEVGFRAGTLCDKRTQNSQTSNRYNPGTIWGGVGGLPLFPQFLIVNVFEFCVFIQRTKILI